MIEDFDLKYREGLPLVLKQINCDIKPGEKVLNNKFRMPLRAYFFVSVEK